LGELIVLLDCAQTPTIGLYDNCVESLLCERCANLPVKQLPLRAGVLTANVIYGQGVSERALARHFSEVTVVGYKYLSRNCSKLLDDSLARFPVLSRWDVRKRVIP
jgi:hypothetical protein